LLVVLLAAILIGFQRFRKMTDENLSVITNTWVNSIPIKSQRPVTQTEFSQPPGDVEFQALSTHTVKSEVTPIISKTTVLITTPEAITELPALPAPLSFTATTAIETSPASIPTRAIVLTKWEKSWFVEIYTDCKFPDTVCWKWENPPRGYNAVNTLLSEENMYIDPAWNNPHLIFWHNYTLQGTFALSARVDNQWQYLMVLSEKSQSHGWKKETLDLSLYKGKHILLKFSEETGTWSLQVQPNQWYIQDIQIVPNYP